MVEDITGEIVKISMDKLVKAPWNAQEESPEIFNILVDEIQDEGFDHPMLVIKHPNKKKAEDGLYMIISGNHRFDAGRISGMEEFPCIIKDWDEVTAKIKSVQRNKLRGEPDFRKMMELINTIREEKTISDEELAKGMAFEDIEKFKKDYYRKEEERKKEKDKSYSHKDISDELSMVDNVSTILNQIFSEYEGDSIKRGFMFFMHKKQMHLVVGCDDKLKKTIEEAVEYINKNDIDATEYFDKLLKDDLD